MRVYFFLATVQITYRYLVKTIQSLKRFALLQFHHVTTMTVNVLRDEVDVSRSSSNVKDHTPSVTLFYRLQFFHERSTNHAHEFRRFEFENYARDLEHSAAKRENKGRENEVSSKVLKTDR